MSSIVLFGSILRLAAPFGEYGIEVPEFAERDFRVSAFGAKADGTKCTEAFAAAMAACETAGGGRVVVPKGKWLTGGKDRLYPLGRIEVR